MSKPKSRKQHEDDMQDPDYREGVALAFSSMADDLPDGAYFALMDEMKLDPSDFDDSSDD